MSYKGFKLKLNKGVFSRPHCCYGTSKLTPTRSPMIGHLYLCNTIIVASPGGIHPSKCSC